MTRKKKQFNIYFAGGTVVWQCLAIHCDMRYVICVDKVLQDQTGGDRAGKGLDERSAGEMNDSIKTVQYLFRGGYSGMSVQMHQKSEPVLEFGLDDRSEVI